MDAGDGEFESVDEELSRSESCNWSQFKVRSAILAIRLAPTTEPYGTSPRATAMSGRSF